MADTIGGITFEVIEGLPVISGTNLEEITRPFVDGVAFRDIGKQAPPFEMEATALVADAAAAAALIISAKALQGTVVSIVRDNGLTWSDVVVLAVEEASSQARRRVVGRTYSGATGFEVKIRFRCQSAG